MGSFISRKKVWTLPKQMSTDANDESSDPEGYSTDSSSHIPDESEDDFCGETDNLLGQYKLIKRLGKGGFGVVWEGKYDDSVDGSFAIKIGKENQNAKREIEALNKIGPHSNIISIVENFAHTVSDTISHQVIVFPLYQQDLEKYVHSCEGMAVTEIKTIFPKLLLGLRHMHEKGISHTDIKPNNIFVNLCPNKEIISDIVLGDFGCCSWDGSLCKYGKTSAYRSVNIILNEPPTPADDIWSMGCLLFELCCNQYLFDPDPDPDTEIEEINRLHLQLMLEILGPFPRKLALRHRDYFNAKGRLLGNPRLERLHLEDIFEAESDIVKTDIPMLCRLILSMVKYTRRQRATIDEILDDPFFTA